MKSFHRCLNLIQSVECGVQLCCNIHLLSPVSSSASLVVFIIRKQWMTHLLMTLAMTPNQCHSRQVHSQGGAGGEDEWPVERVEEAEQEGKGAEDKHQL